jgi:hypothetical protein
MRINPVELFFELVLLPSLSRENGYQSHRKGHERGALPTQVGPQQERISQVVWSNPGSSQQA